MKKKTVFAWFARPRHSIAFRFRLLQAGRMYLFLHVGIRRTVVLCTDSIIGNYLQRAVFVSFSPGIC